MYPAKSTSREKPPAAAASSSSSSRDNFHAETNDGNTMTCSSCHRRLPPSAFSNHHNPPKCDQCVNATTNSSRQPPADGQRPSSSSEFSSMKVLPRKGLLGVSKMDKAYHPRQAQWRDPTLGQRDGDDGNTRPKTAVPTAIPTSSSSAPTQPVTRLNTTPLFKSSTSSMVRPVFSTKPLFSMSSSRPTQAPAAGAAPINVETSSSATAPSLPPAHVVVEPSTKIAPTQTTDSSSPSRNASSNHRPPPAPIRNATTTTAITTEDVRAQSNRLLMEAVLNKDSSVRTPPLVEQPISDTTLENQNPVESVSSHQEEEVPTTIDPTPQWPESCARWVARCFLPEMAREDMVRRSYLASYLIEFLSNMLARYGNLFQVNWDEFRIMKLEQTSTFDFLSVKEINRDDLTHDVLSLPSLPPPPPPQPQPIVAPQQPLVGALTIQSLARLLSISRTSASELLPILWRLNIKTELNLEAVGLNIQINENTMTPSSDDPLKHAGVSDTHIRYLWRYGRKKSGLLLNEDFSKSEERYRHLLNKFQKTRADLHENLEDNEKDKVVLHDLFNTVSKLETTARATLVQFQQLQPKVTPFAKTPSGKVLSAKPPAAPPAVVGMDKKKVAELPVIDSHKKIKLDEPVKRISTTTSSSSNTEDAMGAKMNAPNKRVSRFDVAPPTNIVKKAKIEDTRQVHTTKDVKAKVNDTPSSMNTTSRPTDYGEEKDMEADSSSSSPAAAGTTSSNVTATNPNRIKMGAKVRVLFDDGFWYTATILTSNEWNVEDDTYNIMWVSDSTTATDVPRNQIETEKFAPWVNQSVSCNWDGLGNFFSCTIREINDKDQVKVQKDDPPHRVNREQQWLRLESVAFKDEDRQKCIQLMAHRLARASASGRS